MCHARTPYVSCMIFTQEKIQEKIGTQRKNLYARKYSLFYRALLQKILYRTYGVQLCKDLYDTHGVQFSCVEIFPLCTDLFLFLFTQLYSVRVIQDLFGLSFDKYGVLSALRSVISVSFLWYLYGVATISRLLNSPGLFRRI